MMPTVQARPDLRRTATRCRAYILPILATFCFIAPALAQDTREINKSGDWTLYSHSGQNPVCFLSARARESEPKGQRRSAYFYITNWPQDSIAQETSVSAGTELRPSSEIEIAIGPARFKFFAQGEKAFIADKGDTEKLITALKKGNVMVIKGTSSAGAALEDKYSLIGVSQGISNLAKGCK